MILIMNLQFHNTGNTSYNFSFVYLNFFLQTISHEIFGFIISKEFCQFK